MSNSISKKPNLFAMMLLASASVILANPCTAQESAQHGWRILFNGKDLDGWNMLNAPHKVEVVNGVIKATTIPGQDNGFLCTCESYGDFILELEVNADLLLDNSGIQYRSLSLSDYLNGRLHGYQVQIENRPPHVSQWSGGIYDEAGRGFLYILEDDPVRQKAYKHNQWNHIRIEAIGTTSRVWINSVPVAHLVDDNILKGLICLQVHGGSHAAERGYQSVYLRNVRIKTSGIEPAPYDDIPVVNLIPNSLSSQEKHQGFELLFDGKTAQGWQGVGHDVLPNAEWKIGDGVITVSTTGTHGSHSGKAITMSKKQYGSFELKFEFKLHSDEAIPGIGYFFGGHPASEREARFGRLAVDNKKHRAKINRDLWKEWNQGVITAHPDNRVEYWLNGYKILEYTRGANEPRQGRIVIDALDSNAVSYRSIKIRELN